MADRLTIERLLHGLYTARVEGRLDSLCGLFSADARFRIVGASDGKAIAIAATGSSEIRPWLSVLLKTFKVTSHQILSTVIDGERSAVHWRADIHSKVTGAVVPTELVDLIEVRDGRIASYREFFVPC